MPKIRPRHISRGVGQVVGHLPFASAPDDTTLAYKRDRKTIGSLRVYLREMVRLRRLELPRGVNPTATSTLRVYQFRHSRTLFLRSGQTPCHLIPPIAGKIKTPVNQDTRNRKPKNKTPENHLPTPKKQAQGRGLLRAPFYGTAYGRGLLSWACAGLGNLAHRF